uniref:(northern house mosquito) hypothetical protein n=1 Tax=Culex pipiens TaxID=7175 RepID=A0A8D8AQ37_CULPI
MFRKACCGSDHSNFISFSISRFKIPVPRFQFQDECESPIWEVRRWVRKWDAGWRKTELIRTSSAFTSFTTGRNQLVLVMTVSPLDQSKLKAPQSATNRGTPYTSSPEEMPTRLVASTKADGTKPSAHVVRPARVRHVHKQGMQGGLNDAPIKSPLASGKRDDEEQSEWTTSENQPSGKGTGLKHGAWRTTTSNMGGCGPASNNIAQSAKRTPSSSSTAFDRRCRRCRIRRDSLVSEKSEMVRKQLKATSGNNQRFAQVSQIWQSTLNRRT